MSKFRMFNQTLTQVNDINQLLFSEKNRKSISFKLFLALCLNLVVSQTVFAAAGGTVSKTSAYAIGLLGIVTIGLAIYLLMAMLQPQRF